MTQMQAGPSVLVLDEADELARIQKLVERLGVDCLRWRGDSGQPPPQPRELLITTGQFALKLPASTEPDSLAAGRVWLCVHGEDFFPLRDRLRERGVHYLVQMTTGDDALRLLLQQILYRGADRRGASRLPMDCAVQLKLRDRTKLRAKLLELSNEGCRFEAERALENSTPLVVAIPKSLGGRALQLAGQVIRSEPARNGRCVSVMQIGELDAQAREQLAAIVRGDRIGTRVTPLAAVPERAPDVYVDGTGIPDWEELARSGDRRRHPRRTYREPVETAPIRDSARSYSAMGLELSVEGMRIVGVTELAVGSEIRVALHSNVGAQPIELEAVVLRDDGRSVALRFQNVGAELRQQIEALMEERPSVERLQGGALDRIVMSEVTSIAQPHSAA
jgi:hypothetical protein